MLRTTNHIANPAVVADLLIVDLVERELDLAAIEALWLTIRQDAGAMEDGGGVVEDERVIACVPAGGLVTAEGAAELLHIRRAGCPEPAVVSAEVGATA